MTLDGRLDEGEPPKPGVSPSNKVEYPKDIDQYEHPYNYDNDIPDDAEVDEDIAAWLRERGI